MRSSLLLLILIFIVLSPSFSGSVIIDGIAAIVNEDVITKSEVYAIEKLALNLSGLPKEENLLQERINHHLVLQQMAKQPPVPVSEEEIQAAIDSYTERHGGQDAISKFLLTIGMNYSDFEVEVQEELSIRKFVTDRFRPFVNITIEDAEKYYTEIYKPKLESMGKEVPAFAESFSEIQAFMVESQVQDRVKEWLHEIRQSATINIKD